MKFLVILSLALLASCTDANIKQITTYGSSARVICYSGGQIIYDGNSTGKVKTETQSDGWYFEDAKTGKLIRTNADCVIEN